MCPSAADGSFRGTKRQTRLGGYDVPKGTVVWVPLYSLHNSRHNWQDADKYLPVSPPTCEAACQGQLHIPSFSKCLIIW